MHQFRFSEIQIFGEYLQEQERSPATVKKYLRHLEQFYLWLPEAKLVDRAMGIAYKEFLSRNHAPGGMNTVLAALNGFFRFRGWQNCTVKPLRIQRQVFSSPETELTKEEYIRLVEAARRKKDTRLELLLLLMTSTGIRVPEIPYVTAAADVLQENNFLTQSVASVCTRFLRKPKSIVTLADVLEHSSIKTTRSCN